MPGSGDGKNSLTRQRKDLNTEPGAVRGTGVLRPENMDLGEHGDQKGGRLPRNCPDSCLVSQCGQPSSWWEAAAFPDKCSSPRGLPAPG